MELDDPRSGAYWFRDFTRAQREQSAKKGHALKTGKQGSGGSFPIENAGDLKNAIQAFGRAKNPAQVKAHIISRAKALGLTKLLPSSWNAGGSDDKSTSKTKKPPAKKNQKYAEHFAFRVDLEGVQLDDSAKSRVQILSIGSWKHPFYGDISIDSTRATRFADNVNNKVRGIDLDIDYDHKARRGDAAGWVKAADADSAGVWYTVEWTEEAREAIKQKKYRYLSADFADEWTDPATGVTHEDVMFGGSLTNRPFIKNMVPVNLSEDEADEARKLFDQEDQMDEFLRNLADTLGVALSDDATDDDVRNAVTASVAKLNESPPPTPDPNAGGEDAALRQLAETNPTIAKMLADQETLKRRLDEQDAALRLSEATAAVTRLSEGKDAVLAPAVQNELVPFLVKLPKQLSDQLVPLVGKLVDGSGVVKLAEPAGGGAGGRLNDEADPTTQFTEGVKKLIAEAGGTDKLSFADAVEQYSRANPDSWNAHRDNSYSFRI